MKWIIPPVSIDVIKSELTPEKFIRHTNFGGNEIYILNAANSPNILLEIGRLRELTFRSAGGGTGKETDLDEFDDAQIPYEQLIVWDPKENEIVGGYRFILGNKVKDKDISVLATSELFNFSDAFLNDYMPYTIELGRSFVQPSYQSTANARKGIFALDNLWDGLGALIIIHPEVKYFFGKVTMYPDFNRPARDLILYFLNKYFGDKEKMVTPIHPVKMDTPVHQMEKVFTAQTYLENYKILSKAVRVLGENIPPLINSYMNISPTMKSFGTAINQHFGEVEETGILIKIDDIYIGKKERHINTFKLIRNRLGHILPNMPKRRAKKKNP
ncbi:MAG: hemolysin [Bacteroidetes bacterium HGW-Bacteroidetes-21]|jgi:hypothetical protein|nr:MAG: hemolysin [Bacteroidetes bacterium HGW-Bacteroidetes-21]